MFRKNKKVNIQKVHSFRDAIWVVKKYIYLKEWESAVSALEDIEKQETDAFNTLIEKIPDKHSEIQKQRSIYNKNIETIKKLRIKYETQKHKYEMIVETKRFTARFNNIKKEIEKLVHAKKHNDALNILEHFFQENKEMTQVTSYYAKEKKKIIKHVEKVKKRNKKKIKDNEEIEALKLAGMTLRQEHDAKIAKKQEQDIKIPFFSNLSNKINFYKLIKEKHKRKALLDEVKILIEEESKAKQEIATKKLEHIHKGLIKEMEKKNMAGFDLYGKILGSENISGDSFGFAENKEKYVFYIGDATGHGVRAGLIVSLLSKVFQENALKEDLATLTYNINNTLHEELQNKNFITGLIFEIQKSDKNVFYVTGMWHEPLLIYRAKEKKVEKIIGWGLAGGIRKIKKVEDIKPHTFELSHGDVILTYSDGVLEAKGTKGDFYGLEKLQDIFQEACSLNTDIKQVYASIIEDLKVYRGGSSFVDDTTVMMFRRNVQKDILTAESAEIQEIKAKEHLSRKEVKRLEGKNTSAIKAELTAIKKEKQTKQIIEVLKWLDMTGEYLKLKQEAIRYIKEGYIHKKINYYLKKALDNEEAYKISQKNTKMENKYNVLLELYKKKDFWTVIRECNEIIAKDGNL